MDSSSKTLGFKLAKCNGDGTDLRGSKAKISSCCKGIEEEVEASSLLLKEASLTSLFVSDSRETISE